MPKITATLDTTGVLPVPGLSGDASQAEPQAKPNEGVNGSNNPQRGRDDPGGLVKNSSNHRQDDDETKARDGPHLGATHSTEFTDSIQIYKKNTKQRKNFKVNLPGGSFWLFQATYVSHIFPELLEREEPRG